MTVSPTGCRSNAESPEKFTVYYADAELSYSTDGLLLGRYEDVDAVEGGTKYGTVLVAVGREFCHSAAPPSPFSRRFDRDGEGTSVT